MFHSAGRNISAPVYCHQQRPHSEIKSFTIVLTDVDKQCNWLFVMAIFVFSVIEQDIC